MVEYTRYYVEMPIVWSIRVNTAGYGSSESKQLGVNWMCNSIMDQCIWS